MAGKLISQRKQIFEYLESTVPSVVYSNARRVLMVSGALVPQPGKSRGYAVGALKASGHLQTDDGDIGPYNRAIAAAIAASDGRILRREQIDLPSVPTRRAQQSTTRVYYPLDYAAAIHDGFFHRRAGKFIIGTAYLISAMNETEPIYFEEMIAALRGIQRFEVLSDAELEAAHRRGEISSERVKSAKETRALRREFRGSLPKEELRLQKGRIIGFESPKEIRISKGFNSGQTYFRAGKPIRNDETKAERVSRLESLFQAWLSVRGSDDPDRAAQDVFWATSAGESGF